MKVNVHVNHGVRDARVSGRARLQWLLGILAGVWAAGAFVAPVAAAEVALVVVDVVAVADGYRVSELRGATVVNPKNERVGELDDLIVGKDRVLFAIVEVGGFLGVGGRLIAVPYTSLQISEDGRRIVLPGATKEQVKKLPEFKYRSNSDKAKRE